MKAGRGVRVAAVDAGSNATRLLLGEYRRGGAFVEEMFLRVPLRLGGDGIGGVWSAQKIRKLAMILRAYRIIIEAAAPDKWQAVATAALRECQNRDEVVASVRRIGGITLRVLGGREEAALAGRFVASSFGGRAVLNMDTGGGSTDCALVKKGEVLAAESFLLGTARRMRAGEKRQMQLWLRQQASAYSGGGADAIVHRNDKSDKNGKSDKNDKSDKSGNIGKSGKGVVLTGSGGSVRALEKICGGVIDKTALTKLLPVIAKMPPSLRARRFGLTADRAVSIVPAMRLYLCALEATNAPRLHAIEGGLCLAVITDIAAHHFAGLKPTARNANKQ